MDVMKQAEDLDSLSDLHALYAIMHTIRKSFIPVYWSVPNTSAPVSMNDHGIYDYILNEDVFLGVVGILEYDPEFPAYKASYRDFLQNSSEYMQVLEIRDPIIQRKIHQTYRLQYLKDVVLARVLDDSTFNVLSSFIMVNQIDIINHIMQDATFLNDLLRPFLPSPDAANAHIPPNTIVLSGAREQAPSPPATPNTSAIFIPHTHQNGGVADAGPFMSFTRLVKKTNSKPDTLRFIHQLCLMGKNVQIPTRIALYRTLVERGVLFALEWALRLPPPSMKKGKEAEVSQSQTQIQTHSLSASISTSSETPVDDGSISDADRAALLDAAAEVLIVVVDHHVAGVRSHIVKQFEVEKAREHAAIVSSPLTNGAILGPKGSTGSGKKAETGSAPNLLRALLGRLGGTKEVLFRNQIGDSLKLLLELPNMDFHGAGPEVCSSFLFCVHFTICVIMTDWVLILFLRFWIEHGCNAATSRRSHQ